MIIEIRKLSDLKYADYNPRKSLTPDDPEYQKIARSIDEFGYVDPIIINSDNTIIGGHQRATVLSDKGCTEVQVVVVDLPKDKEKALNIALNKISGEWDNEKLSALLDELNSSDIDATVTGFDEDEIESILSQLHEVEIEEDNYDADEEYSNIETPYSMLGDIWTLGNHRLMCGDSCNPDDVDKLMNGDKAQMNVIDPPYNCDYEGGTKDKLKIQNDNMDEDSFYNFLLAAFQNMYSTSVSGAAIYVFHSETEGTNFRKAFIDSGFLLKQCLIWVKNALVIGRQDYQWKHEPILYGWKDGAAHYFTEDRTQTTVFDESSLPDFNKMKKEELLNFIINYFKNLKEYPETIIYCDKPIKSEDHPTMKPIPLVGKLISNSSKDGWIVQDLFGGSGTTLIASEQLGRKSRLMELDPKYVDVIIKRYIKYCESKGNEPKLTLCREGVCESVAKAIFDK